MVHVSGEHSPTCYLRHTYTDVEDYLSRLPDLDMYATSGRPRRDSLLRLIRPRNDQIAELAQQHV